MHRLSLLIVLSGFLCAQSPSGAPLAVTAPQSVKAMVDLQAVLMPYSVNRDLFGKYIADTYAVVFLSVGNRSREAGLVLEGLSLDYSNWALSGVASQEEAFARSLESFQASTQVGRVSSVEYRIVRAQLEEQDTKTARSWAIRFLEYASSAMGSTGFLFGPATNAPRYVGALTGVGIPGFEKFWPDALIPKLNRVSDLAYHSNRIIPRESSDIMLGFFPLERFLTPSLKSIYVKRPALFFNTGLALIDNQNPKVGRLLALVAGQDVSALQRQIPAMLECRANANPDRESTAACETSRPLRNVLVATSLNTIRVVVNGSMVVAAVAAPAISQ